MTVNPLPPQAYTKETLQKAYAWLLTQSPSVKDLASTQDMLISLYLKAQRSGEASLDMPSIQNFKQELKNLASMMGDLHTPASSGSHQMNSMAVTAASPAPQTQASNRQSDNSGGANNNLGQLDMQSLQILTEVRQFMNLSSDIEALRALITLGYKQIKKMA